MRDQKKLAPPECYTISYRKRMGAEAQTRPLTEEHETDEVGRFNELKNAKLWVSNSGQRDRVYIIRNRKGEQVVSLCWKESAGNWGPINCANYYGGYKIGQPHNNACSCCAGPIDQPDHPSCRPPSEDA